MDDSGSPPGFVLDAGLQPERTELAWSRTALSLVVGGLLALRVLAPPFGTWGIVLGLGGTLAGVLLGTAARRRARAISAALRAGRRLPPGGPVLCAVALAVAGGALVGLVAVVALSASRV